MDLALAELVLPSLTSASSPHLQHRWGYRWCLHFGHLCPTLRASIFDRWSLTLPRQRLAELEG